MRNPDSSSVLPAVVPRVWRLALPLSGSCHGAEELLRRTRAPVRWDDESRSTAPLIWTLSLLERGSPQQMRRRTVRPPHTDSGHKALVAAVGNLPEVFRAVMLLVAVEGLSYREATYVLGVPIGTVMSRLAGACVTLGLRFAQRSVNSLQITGAAA